MLCNFWVFTCKQRPKFKDSHCLKVSILFLSATVSISCSPNLSGRSKSSVTAENGFLIQLTSSFEDGKYFLMDFCQFFRCYINSEAISDKSGVSDSGKKSCNVGKHLVISFVTQDFQKWIPPPNFASILS